MSDKKKRDEVIKDIKIQARVPLGTDEAAQLTVAAAEAGAAYDQMEAEEKTRAKAARERLNEKYTLYQRLRKDVLDKSKDGFVDGFERWDYDRFEVDTVRRDTGEVVNVRPMSAEERRDWKEPPLDLDLDANGKPPKDSKAAAPSEGGQVVVLSGRNKKGAPKPEKAT